MRPVVYYSYKITKVIVRQTRAVNNELLFDSTQVLKKKFPEEEMQIASGKKFMKGRYGPPKT